MTDAIAALAARCNAEDGVRAIIITGAGEKALCVVSDIAELARYDTAWHFRNRPDYCDAVRRLVKAGHRAFRTSVRRAALPSPARSAPPHRLHLGRRGSAPRTGMARSAAEGSL